MKNFYKNKRILVTGHTGFKGGWLSLLLNDLGADVTGYALNPPTTPSFFEAVNLGAHINSVIGEINDRVKLKKVLEEVQPDIVFHLAAQPLVKSSYLLPYETFMTNVMGTVNLFEAIKSVGTVKTVVNITSDKCYKNDELAIPFREDFAMGGYDPYSSSKGCAELVTDAYKKSFFEDMDIAVASVRAGNVFGGGDWAEDRLIPDIIRAIVSDKKIKIRNPKSIRPWQHVLEPLFGYIKLAKELHENKEFAQGWNFGADEEDSIPVMDLTQKIIDLWDDDIQIVLDDAYNPPEAHHLKLDCTKAKEELGWQPALKLDGGLQFTIEWYKAFYDKEDMHDLSRNQIRRFWEMIN